MKGLFAKENFFKADISENGKKERRFYTILTIALFVLGSFTFWEFLFEFSNMVGSVVSGTPGRAIEELQRMFPLLFTALVEIYLAMFVNAAYRAGSEKSRVKIWRANGRVTVVLGAIIAVYVVVGWITGLYGRIVEGYISPLFPLDMMFGGLLLVLFGIMSVRYAGILEGKHTAMYFTNSKTRRGHRRHTCNGWMVYSYMCALCSFAACIYGIFVLDFAHGNIFYNIMLWLNYFTAFAMAVVYRFVYVELKDEYRNTASHKLGSGFLLVNIVLFALYMVSVQLENEAPNLNAFGILPVDFTASFNAFTVLYALNNLIAPLAAICRGEKK